MESHRVERIVSLQSRTTFNEFDLDPLLITNLSGNHERRRLVKFADIPPRLVHAVVSVEDKRFFEKFVTVKGIGPKTALRALTDAWRREGAA